MWTFIFSVEVCFHTVSNESLPYSGGNEETGLKSHNYILKMHHLKKKFEENSEGETLTNLLFGEGESHLWYFFESQIFDVSRIADWKADGNAAVTSLRSWPKLILLRLFLPITQKSSPIGNNKNKPARNQRNTWYNPKNWTILGLQKNRPMVLEIAKKSSGSWRGPS